MILMRFPPVAVDADADLILLQTLRDILPLEQGFDVHLDIVIPRRNIRWRLDVAGVRRRAGNVLARAIVAELARDA